MALKRKFRGFSRKETAAGKAFKRLTLLDTVKCGDLKGLKRLLGRSDINLEETNDTGETALILAAILGDSEALRLLAENGALIDAKSDLSTTALMAAAQNGDLEALRYLISKGADPNARKRDETTILMLAGMFGQAECVEALLEAGACVTAEDIYGYTALMLTGNEECIALLSTAEARAKEMQNKGISGAGSTPDKKLKRALATAGRKSRKARSTPKKEKQAYESAAQPPR